MIHFTNRLHSRSYKQNGSVDVSLICVEFQQKISILYSLCQQAGSDQFDLFSTSYQTVK